MHGLLSCCHSLVLLECGQVKVVLVLLLVQVLIHTPGSRHVGPVVNVLSDLQDSSSSTPPHIFDTTGERCPCTQLCMSVPWSQDSTPDT